MASRVTVAQQGWYQLQASSSDAKARTIAQQTGLWVYHTGLKMPLPFWLPPVSLTLSR